jgi:hypothetical protein
MTRKSSFRLVAPLAVLLATTVLSLTPAKAWEPAWQSDDGSVTLWYENDSNGNTKLVVTIEKDGKFGVYFEKGVIDAVLDKWDNSNPDPNDPNNGKGTDKPDKEAILRQIKDAIGNVKNTPENSPLGGIINGHGGGKVPHWNPGGDDNGNGPKNPPSSKDHKPGGLTAEQQKNLEKMINDAARQVANIKQGMGDGTEGGTEGPPTLNMHGGVKKNGNNGKGHGDEDGDGNNDYKDPYLPKGENLGPKPELVNPQPDLKTKGVGKGKTLGTVKTTNLGASKTENLGGAQPKGTGKVVKTEKKTDTKTAGSSLLGPGLLDNGGGFGGSGPAGAGAPAVHGGAISTRTR